MTKIYLKKNREKLPLNHHPWIFSGAVQSVDGCPAPGQIVSVYSAENRFIAMGHYNPSSKIIMRLLEWNDIPVDETWYRVKIEKALQLRKSISLEKTSVYRLIYSEGDFLPGLIVDRYNDFLVLQALTAGFDSVKEMISGILLDLVPGIKGIYEKSDGDGRKMEGLEASTGLLAGCEMPSDIIVKENGYNFGTGVMEQKTGFYIDQRENRTRVAAYARGRDVLDIFSYTGGFSVYCIAGGARSCVLCDSSETALLRAEKNIGLNNLIPGIEYHHADAFMLLRDFRERGRRFDMIILDPPKLVPSAIHLKKGLKAYKDLNFNAMNLLNPGGILTTFSCSGAVTMEMLKEAVAFASKDSGREAQIIEQLHQGWDHPVRSSIPETEYLKGLILRVD